MRGHSYIAGLTLCAVVSGGCSDDTSADAQTSASGSQSTSEPATSSESESGDEPETETETETGEPDNPWQPGDPCWTEPIAGNFTIEGEAQLEAIGGYVEITGSLRISSASLTQLSRLDCLERVGGDLQLTWNDALEDLGALAGLTSVGGDLLIRHNAQLESFAGLDQAVGEGGALVIEANASLTSFAGLSGFASIEDLTIADNPR